MKPNKGNNNNRKTTFGLVTLILWALALALVLRACSSSADSANKVQIDYSVFRQWVAADLVESVEMQSNEYTIHLKEGMEEKALAMIPEEDEEDQDAAGGTGLMNPFAGMTMPGMPQEVEFKYVTTPLPILDADLLQLLNDHDVQYETPPADSSEYIITLLISTFLPIVLMVGAMVFLFRGIGGKGAWAAWAA